MENKLRVVFSQRKAGELMIKGFKLVKVDKNKKFPNLSVFYFRDTEAFDNALNELISSESAGKANEDTVK